MRFAKWATPRAPGPHNRGVERLLWRRAGPCRGGPRPPTEPSLDPPKRSETPREASPTPREASPTATEASIDPSRGLADRDRGNEGQGIRGVEAVPRRRQAGPEEHRHRVRGARADGLPREQGPRPRSRRARSDAEQRLGRGACGRALCEVAEGGMKKMAPATEPQQVRAWVSVKTAAEYLEMSQRPFLGPSS